jgi:hypothetical protein
MVPNLKLMLSLDAFDWTWMSSFSAKTNGMGERPSTPGQDLVIQDAQSSATEVHNGPLDRIL